MEPNDSPEIPDREETSNIRGLPSEMTTTAESALHHNYHLDQQQQSLFIILFIITISTNINGKCAFTAITT